MSIPSYSNHRYFLTAVADFTQCTWIFLLLNKGEARVQLQNFITYVKVQFDASVKQVRTDNGAEFRMHSFFAEHGILHQLSCPYTPQQNGSSLSH